MKTADRALTRRELLWLLGAGALYTALAVTIGMRKGGDLSAALDVVQRWLAGTAAYEKGPAYAGTWWPPFTIAALAPLTLVSLAAAKGIFAALTAGCVVWSVARAARAWGWAVALLALGAVSKPMQTNIEVLNLNAVLLALLVATAIDLRRGRDRRAGVWIGVATALKVFPALLLVYFGLRRQWRALAIGLVVAGALTALALLRHGPSGGIANFVDWLTLNAKSSIPPEARTSQSLEALVLRLGGASWLVVMVKVAAVAAAAFALRTNRSDPWYDVGLVALVAVLVSPIAWDHYYLMFYVAWVALLVMPAPPRYPRWWRAGLIIAGILTSGILLAVVPTWLRWQLLLQSIYAWGAVLLLLLLVVGRWTSGASRMKEE